MLVWVFTYTRACIYEHEIHQNNISLIRGSFANQDAIAWKKRSFFAVWYYTKQNRTSKNFSSDHACFYHLKVQLATFLPESSDSSRCCYTHSHTYDASLDLFIIRWRHSPQDHFHYLMRMRPKTLISGAEGHSNNRVFKIRPKLKWQNHRNIFCMWIVHLSSIPALQQQSCLVFTAISHFTFKLNNWSHFILLRSIFNVYI